MDYTDTSESESAIIGTILTNNSVLDKVMYLEQKHFSNAALGRIYNAASELRLKNEPIDNVSLYNHMGREKWVLERFDSIKFMGGSSATAASYAKSIVDAHTRRSIVLGCTNVAEMAKDGSTPTDELLTRTQEFISDAIVGAADEEPELLRSIIDGCVKELAKGKETEKLLKTGIQSLDWFTGGISSGLVTIIAARPAMGKSTMAINLITNIGNMGKNVLFTSMEDTAHFIGLRMLSRFSGINSSKLVQSEASATDMENIGNARGMLPSGTVWIDDKPGRTASNIRYTAAMLQKKHGLDLLVIDHLGELTNDEKSYSSTSANIRSLRDIAKQLNIPVVVLCQLNRSKENEKDKRPTLSSLRDSGRIEEVARSVWFLHREHYYNNEAPEDLLEVIVAKSSHGRTGRVKLSIDLPHMTIGE
jgi:replicative DNA helicase